MYPAAVKRALVAVVNRWSSVIAVSSSGVTKEFFGHRNPPKAPLITLYPPVDTDAFTPTNVDLAALRSSLGLPASAVLLGSVGHVNPCKGFEYLIGALPQIRQRHADAQILIVGECLDTQAVYRKSLDSLIRELGLEDAVTFMGPRSDISHILPALTVYVQSSREESAGMAMMEASAAAVPVVTARVASTEEFVIDGVSGLVVEPRSSIAIGAAVCTLLEEPDRASTMAGEARSRMLRLFSPDASAAQHLSAYNRALTPIRLVSDN
jgi:glycosyltransferase involved in cell wall biosynthesis